MRLIIRINYAVCSRNSWTIVIHPNLFCTRSKYLYCVTLLNFGNTIPGFVAAEIGTSFRGLVSHSHRETLMM
jgi:hypothetical protein